MSDGAPILTQTGWPPAKGGDVEALEARADAKEWLDRVAEESPAEALRLYLALTDLDCNRTLRPRSQD